MEYPRRLYSLALQIGRRISKGDKVIHICIATTDIDNLKKITWSIYKILQLAYRNKSLPVIDRDKMLTYHAGKNAIEIIDTAWIHFELPNEAKDEPQTLIIDEYVSSIKV